MIALKAEQGDSFVIQYLHDVLQSFGGCGFIEQSLEPVAGFSGTFTVSVTIVFRVS